MDTSPIILGALEIGNQSKEPSVTRAFTELKVIVLNAFGENFKARRALDDFLEDPETYLRPLAKALSETGVDKDQAILDAAGRLLRLESPDEPDILQRIAERERIRTGDRFSRHAQSIADVKAQETATSRQRMDQYWEAENQRRAEIAERQARIKQQERRLLIGVLVIAAVILIVFVAVMIFAGRG